MKWNCKRFDYTTGTLGGDWDLADVHWFVDKEFGDDTNAGTANAPFATLTKAHTVATAGQVIMISGYFSENLAISKAVRIVGVSGMNGRAVFASSSVRITYTANTSNIILDNILFLNYNNEFFHLTSGSSATKELFFSNCIISVIIIGRTVADANIVSTHIYSYLTLFDRVQLRSEGSLNRSSIFLYGNNNTYIDLNLVGGSPRWWFHCLNSWYNKTFTNTFHAEHTVNNLVNTDARFFADDTETTPKLLTVVDPIINYNFRRELPHWDKTAGAYKTINPLYRTGTFDVINQMYRHIGAGNEVHVFNGYDTAFIDEGSGGTGTWTNIEVGGSGELYRTSTGSDGTIETGIIQFSRKLVGFTISLRNSVEVTANIVTKAIQSLDHTLLSKRAGYAIQIKIGDTTGQVDICNWFDFEYGWKPVSYSLDGTTKVGNADAAFDETSEVIAGAKYIKLKIIFKSL